ncbi:MAG: polyprenyl synthetase family protein [Bacteroidetes bacterium]|nr:polyprenyl synthetase family protein [Bacteroidota bacterium]
MKKYHQLLEESFSGFSNSLPENPSGLYEPIRYTLSIGGKRMRPLLTLIGAGLFSEDVTCALNAAKGIELFHNFTLLHDDIMDNAPLRRGKQSVFTKWNSNIAILSGDAMHTEAVRQLAMSPKEILPEVLDIFTKTALQVCEGQQLDMDFEKLSTVSIDDYLNMIELKTSVLLAASLEIGAICAGADKVEAKKLYEFGKHVGLAFQLQDDILDVFGDANKFGKKVGGDIVANKKTYLLLKAFELANQNQKDELQHLSLFSEEDASKKIEAVKNIYDQLGVKKFAEDEMHKQYQTGISALESVQVDSTKKSILKNFTDELMVREN